MDNYLTAMRKKQAAERIAKVILDLDIRTEEIPEVFMQVIYGIALLRNFNTEDKQEKLSI